MKIRHDMVTVFVARPAEAGWEILQLLRVADLYMDVTWAIVRGGIEAGETAPQAACRELFEETALTPVELYRCGTVETFYLSVTDTITHGTPFVAVVAYDAELVLNEEHTDHRWLPLAEYQRQIMWASERGVFADAVHDILLNGPAKPHLRIELT